MQDPSSTDLDPGRAGRESPDPLFIPTVWDRRIPGIHRLLSISMGVLVPLVPMVVINGGMRGLWPALCTMMLVALPYRAAFLSLAIFSMVMGQQHLRDASLLVLGSVLMVVGRLKRLPFWGNAYLVRYVIISMSFWIVYRLGLDG